MPIPVLNNQLINPNQRPGSLGVTTDPTWAICHNGLVVHNRQVIGPQQPAIDDGLTTDQKVAAILDRMRNHGLIAS